MIEVLIIRSKQTLLVTLQDNSFNPSGLCITCLILAGFSFSHREMGVVPHMIVIASNRDTNSFYFLAEAISRLVYCNVIASFPIR